jgi:hypothetical protein
LQVVNDFNSNWNNIKNVNFQFIQSSIYVNGAPPMFNEPHVLSPFPSCYLSFLTIWGFCSLGKWLLAFFFDGWNFPCIYLHIINQQSLIFFKNPTSNSILYDSNIYWNVPFEKYCFDPILMDYSKQYFFSIFQFFVR